MHLKLCQYQEMDLSAFNDALYTFLTARTERSSETRDEHAALLLRQKTFFQIKLNFLAASV